MDPRGQNTTEHGVMYRINLCKPLCAFKDKTGKTAPPTGNHSLLHRTCGGWGHPRPGKSMQRMVKWRMFEGSSFERNYAKICQDNIHKFSGLLSIVFHGESQHITAPSLPERALHWSFSQLWQVLWCNGWETTSLDAPMKMLNSMRHACGHFLQCIKIHPLANVRSIPGPGCKSMAPGSNFARCTCLLSPFHTLNQVV